MDVDDACQQWMLSPLSGWLLFVVFIFQFVADVGCLLHLLSKCCCRPWRDSTWECNVMMQCASHHILITLSGWLLFVVCDTLLPCYCMLFFFVTCCCCSMLCCLLYVVVLVLLMMDDYDGCWWWMLITDVDDGCWWWLLLLSDTMYFVTNWGKLRTFWYVFSCSLDDKISGSIPGNDTPAASKVGEKAQLLDIG